MKDVMTNGTSARTGYCHKFEHTQKGTREIGEGGDIQLRSAILAFRGNKTMAPPESQPDRQEEQKVTANMVMNREQSPPPFRPTPPTAHLDTVEPRAARQHLARHGTASRPHREEEPDQLRALVPAQGARQMVKGEPSPHVTARVALHEHAVLAKRPQARQQGEQHNAGGKHVGLAGLAERGRLVVGDEPLDVGRDVRVGAAGYDWGLGSDVGVVLHVAEVGELDDPRLLERRHGVDQDVLRLDVAVDETLRVEELQGLHQLLKDDAGVGGREGTPRGELRRAEVALEELHPEVGDVVDEEPVVGLDKEPLAPGLREEDAGEELPVA